MSPLSWPSRIEEDARAYRSKYAGVAASDEPTGLVESGGSGIGGGGGGGSQDDEDDFLDEVNFYLDTHAERQRLAAELPEGGRGIVGVLAQLWIIVELGLPICVEKFSSFFPATVLLGVLGRLPQDPSGEGGEVGSVAPGDAIAGAGMGFMFGNVTGVSVVIGFALGLPPLISQAYGAQNYGRCGDLLQTQLCIHLLVIAPCVALVWLYAEPILIGLGQPEKIAALAAEFLWWRLPALPCLCVWECLGNHLKAQRVVRPTMAAMVATNLVILALLPWIILAPTADGADGEASQEGQRGSSMLRQGSGLGLGFKGGPMALTLANLGQALFVCLAARACGRPETWPLWSVKRALTGWGEMVAVSLPSAFMMFGEWWAWETTLFLAGLLCPTSQATQAQAAPGLPAGAEGGNATAWLKQNGSTNPAADGFLGDVLEVKAGEPPPCAPCVELEVFPIVSNTMVLFFFLHMGYSVGAGAHVGNLVGAGQPALARLAAHCCLGLVGAISGAPLFEFVAYRG